MGGQCLCPVLEGKGDSKILVFQETSRKYFVLKEDMLAGFILLHLHFLE